MKVSEERKQLRDLIDNPQIGAIAEEELANHPNMVNDAIKATAKRVRALDAFSAFTDEQIHTAAYENVHRLHSKPKVFGMSEEINEIYKELRETAAYWRPTKEIEKIIKRMAKIFAISERATIDRAILEMWERCQPKSAKKPRQRKEN
jgi:hypothetical protein